MVHLSESIRFTRAPEAAKFIATIAAKLINGAPGNDKVVGNLTLRDFVSDAFVSTGRRSKVTQGFITAKQLLESRKGLSVGEVYAEVEGDRKAALRVANADRAASFLCLVACLSTDTFAGAIAGTASFLIARAFGWYRTRQADQHHFTKRAIESLSLFEVLSPQPVPKHIFPTPSDN